MKDFYLSLFETGFIERLGYYYQFLIIHSFIYIIFNYFINEVYDRLVLYLTIELEKDWYYEQSTDMETGLTNLNNVMNSLDSLTQRVKRQVEINKREKERIAKILKKQEETIKKNRIEHVRWLEEYYRTPPTKEREQAELKQLLKDMRKKYKKWLD